MKSTYGTYFSRNRFAINRCATNLHTSAHPAKAKKGVFSAALAGQAVLSALLKGKLVTLSERIGIGKGSPTHFLTFGVAYPSPKHALESCALFSASAAHTPF